MEFSAERYIPRFTSVVFQAPEMVTSPMSYFWLVVLDGGVDMTNFTLVILMMLNRSRAAILGRSFEISESIGF